MKSVASHRTASWQEKPSLLVTIRDTLAIVAIIMGGAWAGIEFFWDRLLAPRLAPAVLQQDITHKVVGSMACCTHVEVNATVANTGKREAHILTSTFVAGAAALEMPAPIDAAGIHNRNDAAIAARVDAASGAKKAPELPVFFGLADLARPPYAVLGVGDLIRPSTRLESGEKVSRQFVFLVPRERPFVSFHTNIVVAHREGLDANLTWTWYTDASTLGSKVMPWPTAELSALTELRRCTLEHQGTRRSLECEATAFATAQKHWESSMGKDRHAYTSPYVYEFAAIGPISNVESKTPPRLGPLPRARDGGPTK